MLMLWFGIKESGDGAFDEDAVCDTDGRKGLVPRAIAAAAVTAPATATTAAASFFPRTSFIDGQRATFPIFAVQSGNGRLGAFFGIHGGEGEAARATGHFIHYDADLVHGAMGGQHVAQIVFGGVKGKIPQVQFRAHNDLDLSRLRFPGVPDGRVSNHH